MKTKEKIPRKIKKRIRLVMRKRFPKREYKISGLSFDKSGFFISFTE